MSAPRHLKYPAIPSVKLPQVSYLNTGSLNEGTQICLESDDEYEDFNKQTETTHNVNIAARSRNEGEAGLKENTITLTSRESLRKQ